MMDMGGEMPPMEPSMEGDPNMAMDPSNAQMEPSGDKMPTSFDSNFDPGVKADEETDPKKFIQQLTGKLSQSLNSYNNENGTPDTELGKFSLGMIIPQAVKGMDEKDKKDLIKKINTASDEETSMPDDEDMNVEEPMNPEMDSEIDSEMGDEPQTQMESKTFSFTKKQIFESFGINMDDATVSVEKHVDQKITPDTTQSRRAKPFRAPKKFETNK